MAGTIFSAKPSEDAGAWNFRVNVFYDENSLASVAFEAERERVLHGDRFDSRGVDEKMKKLRRL